jgi:hypothetical protein
MPGDPKECCPHAPNCIRLAKEASTEEVRKTFFDLAQKWNALAADLDTAQAFLDAAKGDKL